MNSKRYLDREDVPVDVKEEIRREIIKYKQTEDDMQAALKESQQRQAEVAALLESSRAVLEYHKFEDAARFIFDSCKNLIGATAGYIALLSEDGTENELVFLDSGGLPCTVDPSLPMPIRGLRAEAYRTGNAIYDNDFSKSEWMKYMPEGHTRLDNVMFAPLVIKGKTVGLLGLANKSGGFTENDIRMASAFGEHVAVALYNSWTLESLESSEKRFRSLVETANDAIIIIQDWVKYVNPKFVEISGFSLEEAIGKSFFALVCPEYLELLVDRQKKIISGDDVPDRYEIELLTKLGGRIPVEINISTIEYEGKPADMGIIRDITEWKHLERQLVESEEKYRSLVENDPNMIFFIKERVLIFVNQAFLDTLEYSKEELYDPSFDFFAQIIPEQREMFKEHLIEILAGEKVQESYELSLITKRGKIVTCLANLTSFEMEGENVIQGVLTDIRKIKELEKELKDSEERYRGLYESSVDGIISYDMERNILECNQSFADMHGYTKEEMYQLTLWDLIYEKWHDVPEKIRTEQVLKRGYSDEFETEHVKKDRKIFPVSIRVWLMKDKVGRPTGMWGIVRDITGRKKAENALKMVAYNLRERVKEIRCLYNISKLVDKPGILLEEILQGVVELIPPAWQYPEIACAKVILEDQEFKTENFRETIWKQTSDIIVHDDQIGALEICYLKEMPESDEGPFLNEERSLINAIAERVGKIITHKQAEEALRRERDNFINIFDSMVDGVYIVNQNYDIEYINPVIRREFGLSEGKKCYEYFHDREEDCPWCKNQKVFAGNTVRWEWYSFKNNKTYDLIDTPLKNPDGSISKLEIFRDITELKLVEEKLKENTENLERMVEKRTQALRESEERLKAILTGIGDLVTIQNKDLDIIWANQAIMDIWGDVIGKSCYEVYKCLDAPCPQCTVEMVFNEGKTLVSEQTVIRPDGTSMNTLVTSSPVRDAEGNIVAAVEVVKDITKRKRAEEALQKSEASLAKAQRIAHLGNWDWNILTNELYWSDEIYRIFGLAPQEFDATYEAFLNSVHPEDKEFVKKSVDRALYDDEPYSIDHRIVLPDGEVRTVHEQADITFDETGRPIRMVGTVQDITERKKLEQQLFESEERYRG